MSINKKIAVTLLAGLLTGSVVNATPSLVERESINQVALLQSLAQGYLGGTIKVKDIRAVGDTGIGTFEGVNGEMIVLDGTVYQALGDGRVVVADDKVVVPYATVTMFDDKHFHEFNMAKDMKEEIRSAEQDKQAGMK